ncbi:Uncharacterised protein [Mycobacteroides abscessus subsp. massiliense]|nr:Uncharacterised protein [Mycobacteroides abscessus subsp. massiliense]
MTVRHSSPCATHGRYRTRSRNSGLVVTAIVSSVPPTTAEYTSTLAAISAQVTQARACRSGLT